MIPWVTSVVHAERRLKAGVCLMFTAKQLQLAQTLFSLYPTVSSVLSRFPSKRLRIPRADPPVTKVPEKDPPSVVKRLTLLKIVIQHHLITALLAYKTVTFIPVGSVYVSFKATKFEVRSSDVRFTP